MLLLLLLGMLVLAPTSTAQPDARGTSTRQGTTTTQAAVVEELSTVTSLATSSAAVALVADEYAVYEATGNRIDRRDVDDLVSKFHRTGISITNLAVDESHLYATAEVDADTNIYALLRLDKITLETLNQLDFAADDNVPFSLSLDASHVYVGFYTFPGKIVKVCQQ
jgi:predicted lactoylglutathione lyase